MQEGRYNPRAIVKVIGEPFQSRCLEYREGIEKAQDAWREFAKSISAYKMLIPSGFIWLDPKKVPKTGWTRVGRPPKHFWRPRKNTPAAKIVAELPREPSSYDVFEGYVHYGFQGASKDGKETLSETVHGFWRGPTIGWAGDVFIAHIPHVGRASRAYADVAPGDFEIPEVFTQWKLPEGLEEITEAEADLIFAQARVDAEREAKAKGKGSRVEVREVQTRKR